MPDWGNDIRERLAGLRLDPAREASVVEEIAQHLDDRYAELTAGGATPEAARKAALDELSGGPALAAALADALPRPSPPRVPPGDDGDGAGWLTGLARDFRYGARRLRLEPAFSLVAILSLALGIGANTAIFQLLDAVRLRSLPVADPSRLYNLRIAPGSRSGNFSGRWPQLTSALWDRIRGEQKAFSKLAVWSSDRVNLASGGEARYAEGLFVSATFFDTVGVGAIRGRVLGPGDDAPGCPSPAAVISERFWRRELGGRDLAPGETVTVEGKRFEIAGVTPARFFGVDVGRAFDVAIPVCAEDLIADSPRTQKRRNWWLAAVGRLAPGWTLEKANAHLAAISKGVFESTLPETYDAVRAKSYLALRLQARPLTTGFSDLREDYSDPLWLLLGISAVVLLIACANIANLMVARASARQREIAVRLALGASRRRLIQQHLAESLVLAAAGAAVGVALAQALSRLLVSFLSTQDTPYFVEMHVDLRLLAFTTGLAALTCVLFGLLPAVQASRTDPIESIKTGGRGVAGAGAKLSVRRALVVSQVALSLALLVGALLFVRSLRNLLAVDAGFRHDHILAVGVDYTRAHVPREQRTEFRRELLDRARAVPGVTAAATADIVPLTGDGWNDDVSIEGTEVQRKTANFNRVSPGYFGTMETAFITGRDFEDRDAKGSEPVAIVTETLARTFLPRQSPIGRVLKVDDEASGGARRYRIVGLVRDTKYGELREDFFPIVFLPMAQDKEPRHWIAIVVRSDLPLATLHTSLTSAITGVSPDVSVTFRPFRGIVRDGLLRERVIASLSAFFGFLAAILAMIGLYGVVSFMVVRRRNEIGVRMALGANRRDILVLVLREAGTLVGLGLAIGIVLAIGTASLARSFLFGLQPFDPATLAMAALGLTAVAAAASLLPAHRAATLDPVAALREE
jgi:putative ABC transport system permease protein